MGNGTPTIVVHFGDSAASSAFFLLELDDIMNVDLAGKVKTQFLPGESQWVRIQYDATVQITTVKLSSGMFTFEGIVPRDAKERLSFEATDTPADVKYIPNGGLAPAWFGRSPNITRKGRSITADDAPAIGDISYKYQAELWRYDPEPMTLAEGQDFPVLIVIYVDSVPV